MSGRVILTVKLQLSDSWRFGVNASTLLSINEVALRRARLLLDNDVYFTLRPVTVE